MLDYSINVNGRLLDLSQPQVMGILNVTPDSFYGSSRCQSNEEIAVRTHQILSEGAAIIDVGACSTRPGSAPVDEAEEWRRLDSALAVVRREAPEAVVSVDTFRPAVARRAVEGYGVAIINDVGGTATGGAEAGRKEMYRMVSRLGVPYVVTSHAADIRGVLLDLAAQVQQLRELGQKDIIVDPGFGFGKSGSSIPPSPSSQDEGCGDYGVMSCLERLQVLELPVLVGVSRKSMICRLLDLTPDQALNGTTALNMVALMKGASILRVHDVRQAVECCRIMSACTPAPPILTKEETQRPQSILSPLSSLLSPPSATPHP
jgi:dihydropteroate synthase